MNEFKLFQKVNVDGKAAIYVGEVAALYCFKFEDGTTVSLLPEQLDKVTARTSTRTAKGE